MKQAIMLAIKYVSQAKKAPASAGASCMGFELRIANYELRMRSEDISG